jgi:hypothetical protein
MRKILICFFGICSFGCATVTTQHITTNCIKCSKSSPPSTSIAKQIVKDKKHAQNSVNEIVNESTYVETFSSTKKIASYVVVQ